MGDATCSELQPPIGRGRARGALTISARDYDGPHVRISLRLACMVEKRGKHCTNGGRTKLLGSPMLLQAALPPIPLPMPPLGVNRGSVLPCTAVALPHRAISLLRASGSRLQCTKRWADWEIATRPSDTSLDTFWVQAVDGRVAQSDDGHAALHLQRGSAHVVGAACLRTCSSPQAP